MSEATPIRLSVGRAVVLTVAIVTMTFAAALWMNNVHRDVSDLKAWSERFDRRMERVEEALGVPSAFNGANPNRSP